MQSGADCIVVGASFAGLASACALARAGLRVTVIEKKSDPGSKLHTTGLIVKDAIDQVALLDTLPASLKPSAPVQQSHTTRHSAARSDCRAASKCTVWVQRDS